LVTPISKITHSIINISPILQAKIHQRVLRQEMDRISIAQTPISKPNNLDKNLYHHFYLTKN
jgi:hypothetical protein